jgi:hypothetical protein
MRRVLRVLAWGGAGATILLGGLYALGLGLVSLRLESSGAGAGSSVQGAALHALVSMVAREALLPHGAFTLAAWLALARLAPRVDASWTALAASLLACALVTFPLVGFFTFGGWSPRGPGDVVATAALLSASVSAALWLARRIVPGLRPGSFGPSLR